MASVGSATTDVVVVGGGGSGLSAAITAAAAGLRVTLLEKNPALGGSTALSVGSFSAAGTSLQGQHHVADSVAQFAEDVQEMNGALHASENEPLRTILVKEATASFEWLRQLGVQFIGPFDQTHFTASRMHQVVPNSRAYIRALRQEALRRGVDVRVGVRAERLLRAGPRVIGVRAGCDFMARRGVILATGDYSASPALKERWVSHEVAQLPPINPTNTGDGFLMALDVGATVRNSGSVIEDLRLGPPKGVDIAQSMPAGATASLLMRFAIERLPRFVLRWFAQRALTSWVAPSKELFLEGAVLVNRRGERFTNELDAPARRLGGQPDNLCFLVMDTAIAEKFQHPPHAISTFPGLAYAYLDDYVRLRPDVTHVATTIEALAGRMQVDAATLGVTLRDYNRSVDEGHDVAFQRVPLGPGLRRPPYVAMGPILGRVVITDGGLDVNTRCQVLDASGERIPGLYAVGATGQGGLLLKAHGLHIAWAITSGRIAGRAILDEPY